MPNEDEIRALKRELASSGVRGDQARRSAIVAQLALRGESVPGAPAAEKRAATPKKAPAKAKDE